MADNGNGLLIGAGQCRGLKPQIRTYIHTYIYIISLF